MGAELAAHKSGELPAPLRPWVSLEGSICPQTMLEASEIFGQPQRQTCGSLQELQAHPRGIRLLCTQGCWSVQVLTPRLLRLRFSPSGEFLPRRSWDVALADAEWPPAPFELQESPTQVHLSTSLVQLQIDRDPLCFSFRDPQGQVFCADLPASLSWGSESIRLVKSLHPAEHIYGLGERAGLLNKRGRRYSHWTRDCWGYDAHSDNLYLAIPFALLLRPGLCYGLFLHCTHWSQFDLGQAEPEQWAIEVRAPELDYYLIYGPTPALVLQTYTQLTGRTPCLRSGPSATSSAAGATPALLKYRTLPSNFASARSPATSSTWISTTCAATASSPGIPAAFPIPPASRRSCMKPAFEWWPLGIPASSSIPKPTTPFLTRAWSKTSSFAAPTATSSTAMFGRAKFSSPISRAPQCGSGGDPGSGFSLKPVWMASGTT